MKKSILALGLAAVLFSCKKDYTNDFKKTDTTGTTIVSGQLTKRFSLNNGWSTTVPAAGIAVTVRVDNSQLYPNSNAQGSEVYTGVTDANGMYSIAVKTNGDGVYSTITVPGFNESTVVSSQSNVYTYGGTYTNRTLYKGVSSQYSYRYDGYVAIDGSLGAGTATLSGVISGQAYWYTAANHSSYITAPNLFMPNVPVILYFDQDPYSLSVKTYSTVTDSWGRYKFVFDTPNTNSATSQGNPVEAQVYVYSWATTRDTLEYFTTVTSTPPPRITGKTGIYGAVNTIEYGLTAGINRNNVNLTLGAFSEDPFQY